MFIFFTALQCSFADVKLPALVGSNMVLQRDKPLNLWGNADPLEQVTILFKGSSYKTRADEKGAWTVHLPPQKAGGPFEMRIKGKKELVLSDILIGDVWLCSGQSNMYFTTKEVTNAEREVAAANYPHIRLFYVPTTIATSPQNNVKGKWSVCNPESVRNFSAVAYFFARNLQEKIKVPIGLIESSFGGTPVEAWISTEGIANDPQFGAEAKMLLGVDQAAYDKKLKESFDSWIDSLQKGDPAYTNGTYSWAAVAHHDWKTMQLPAYFENQDKNLKDRDGILWFSKEIDVTADDLTENSGFSMGPVVDDDMVLINGNKIGSTRDAKYVPRKYTLPASALHAGTNTITIRVIDYGNFAGINGKAEQFYIKTPARTIPLNGAWSYKVSVDTVFKVPHAAHLNQERQPCLLYNAMIAPLTRYAIKGVIWYQGENNTKKAYQYRSLFTTLIKDWRMRFDNPKLPFLYVQLANLGKVPEQPGNSFWSELREAQALALKLPETGMITAIDLGEADNIHYRNKKAVGNRLAALAETKVYAERGLISEGPKFAKAYFEPNKCILKFRNVGQGLQTLDGTATLTGFQAATGGSEKFVFVKAVIEGNHKVVITSPDGSQITAVRYAWADNPGTLNFVNSAQLPAYPFRTDQFKLLSFDPLY